MMCASACATAASHCDFEDSTDWRCEVLCGAADPARQALIADEAVEAVRAAMEH